MGSEKIKYFVNYGTGAGNFSMFADDIQEVMDAAVENIAYTGSGVYIYDCDYDCEDRPVAVLPWYGCPYDGPEDEENGEVFIKFGDFGYYGHWQYE